MTPPAYAELHCHSNYSFLDGTSDPEELVERAHALGHRAIALTDHEGIYGLVRFAHRAKELGLPAITGAEVTLSGGAHLILLAESLAGYRNLSALVTSAHTIGGKDNPNLPFAVLAERARGLIALSGCERGELTRALLAEGPSAAHRVVVRYRDVFGPDHFFVELHNHLRPEDGPRNAALAEVAARAGLRCLATNNVHYATPDRGLLHHVVTCIRHGTTLDRAGLLLRPNDENYLKSPAQMAWLMRDYPDAIAATADVAARCRFTLADLSYQFPHPELPRGVSALAYLERLVAEGKRRYYASPPPQLDERIEHELSIVRQLNLAGYLLTFHDVVDFCHREGILVSIRGSAPASVLLYCLGLCPIDPLAHGLLFERFASVERRELPDIDLDIAHEDRERVIQYVYERYGRDHTAMVCEVNTYRLKSAIRDIAKVLGFPPQQALGLASAIAADERDGLDRLRVMGAAVEAPASEQPSPTIDTPIQGAIARMLVLLCRQLVNAPRHLSIHVGGMIISSRPITDVLPFEPARMPNRTIIPWDKDDIATLAESFGVCLVKMDLLGLGMLTLVRRVFAHVRQTSGLLLRLHGFIYDDRVFDVLCAGDTVGLFQVESRAQMSFLPQLRPRNLRDTAISVGAIRPGPGAFQAGSRIARRRSGQEPISYPHDSLRPVLGETYGVVLWQEQVMQVAMVLAGYTGGEADQLRRAMSNKRSLARMQEASRDLVRRMIERGHSVDLADRIEKMVLGFAGYGFPRAHAYPFAHLALISATLKLRYPAAFYCALLNSQPMGFYSPHTILWDAYRHGVRFLPVDVNRSAWDCAVEGADVRLGFKQVGGLGQRAREAIETARTDDAFVSSADVVRRTGLDRDALEALAAVGAFLPFADRRDALWYVGELAGLSSPRHLPGFAELLAESTELATMSPYEETRTDYQGLGMSTSRHIISFYRPRLTEWRAYAAIELARLPNRLVVRAGGLVIVRQRPETARKHVFITLEDETGLINVIVRPDVYDRARQIIVGEPLLIVEGLLQLDNGVTQIIARKFWRLPAATDTPTPPSHDFH